MILHIRDSNSNFQNFKNATTTFLSKREMDEVEVVTGVGVQQQMQQEGIGDLIRR